MRSLGEITQHQVDLAVLEVMEPKMLIDDESKVVYINEAMEEALMEKRPEETALYEEAKASHEGYTTRLRRLPVTIPFMKKYAELRHDTFMMDLIERKEPVFQKEHEQYEMSLFDAFKNMFVARNPECKNVYKVLKKIEAYEKRMAEKKESE